VRRVAPWFVAILALVVWSGAAAGEVRVTGAIDPETVEVGESAVLTISVEGAGSVDGTPRMNAPDGISIRSAGESRNFSMVNGRISKSIVLQFVVIALRPGAFTIGPIEVQAGGRAYTAGPFRLTATQGGGGSPPATVPRSPGRPPQGEPNDAGSAQAGAPPIFVDMRAEPTEVSVGQQTTLLIRFWRRADVDVLDAGFIPPETEGFWKEDLPPERHSQASRGGATYDLTEIRMALFPTRAGDLTVSPARVHVQYRDPGGNRGDPFSFFGLGGRQREAEPASNPVSVRARALPKPAPAGFLGAVGRYTIEARPDRDGARQGEPFTWMVTIEGEGNISAVEGPRFPDIPGCRGLDGGNSAKTTKDGDVVGGSKSFSRILIPESAGNLELPSLSWVVFDPREGRYVALTVPSRRIPVVAATGIAADDASRGRVGAAIRGIRSSTRLRSLSTERPWKQAGFWLLQLIPIGALAAAFVLQRRRARIERDPAGARMRRAPRKLRAALAAVAADREDPWGALVHALDEFLVDRYGAEIRGMTRPALGEALVERGCDPGVSASLVSFLEQADARRYTPAIGSGEGDGITGAIGQAADLAARLTGGTRA